MAGECDPELTRGSGKRALTGRSGAHETTQRKRRRRQSVVVRERRCQQISHKYRMYKMSKYEACLVKRLREAFPSLWCLQTKTTI